MRRIGSAALCVALLAAAARAATSADCGAPAAMSDGWAVATPAQQGLDPELICAAGPSLAALKGANPHGVIVARHRTLVYEQYFAGDDQRGSTWIGIAPHDANTLHNMESITKSVIALLVGIAFDRGLLKNLDDPIFSFFPEYADLRTPEKDRITLHHLLSMTSGLDWPERAIPSTDPGNILRWGYVSPDPYRFVLERSIAAMPGTAWNYNGGGVWVLGRVLRKVAELPLNQFAKEALFEPLGIEDWEWGRFPNGDPGTSGSLRLRPRDLAKLGQLVLDGGVWHGRQIVSAEWINQMTSRQSPQGFSFGSWRSYGYLWWQGRSSIDNHEIDWVGAVGRGGQRLYVVPSLGLLVAVTAGLYLESKGGAPSPLENLAGNTALNSFVLPAALGH